MDNLPKDNQNNNPNIITSNLGDDLISPKEPSLEVPEVPETPKDQETPTSSEIEKKSENISEIPKETNKEIDKEEIKNENPEISQEETIEIGSLDKKPSISTLNQETINQSSNETNPVKKNKKGKTIISFVAILLIIIALPLSLILVKQRQEIRKNASESQPAFNDIQISLENEIAPSTGNGGTYTTNFKVKNNVSNTRTVVVEKKSCYCLSGNPPTCNDNCSSTNATLTIGGNQSTNVTISAKQPNGDICGSFQTDLTILSVN